MAEKFDLEDLDARMQALIEYVFTFFPSKPKTPHHNPKIT